MTRRERREDAAFQRGDVGVDGAATEETRDAAEAERAKAREQLLRGRTWLGRELLTWLLWRSEARGAFATVDGEGVEVLFVGRLVLRGARGEVTELVVRGTEAPYAAQVRRALDAGLLVHEARVRLTHGERTYEAGIDAEFLDVRAAKLPELLAEEEDDRAQERLWLAERLSAIVDALAAEFLAARAGRGWRKTVAAMKRWMGEAGGASPARA
jgi:hypothetical protein